MMTQLLIRVFVKDRTHVERPQVRRRYGVLSGVVGIAVNAFLAVLKFAVGFASGSVAVAADAVNNLSDAGSAVVTLMGFKLSAKPADRDHPFGHGRVEHIAGVVVAVVVIAMGLNFLKESALRIVHPGKVDMPTVMIVLVIGAMVLKGWLYFFYRFIGRAISSETIKAASFDSLSDLFATSVVLLSVIFGKFVDFPVDGCAGVAVALLVVVGGVKILRETTDPLLGTPPSPELVNELRSRVLKCRGIRGVHDIIMHNYGPNQYFATAHAEVDPGSDILAVHDLLERAEVEIGKHMPVHLLLHCDPGDSCDPELRLWQGRLENVVADLNPRYKVYDVRLIREDRLRTLTFNLLVPCDDGTGGEDLQNFVSEALAVHPDPPRIRLRIVRSRV